MLNVRGLGRARPDSKPRFRKTIVNQDDYSAGGNSRHWTDRVMLLYLL